jgi:tetratricopeptide (TPR) repeat protein
MRTTAVTALLVALLLGGATLVEAEWEAGVAAFKAQKYAEAEREFEEVVAKQPDWPGGHFMLGQVLLQQKKNKEALEHLKRAYELNPDDVSYQYALGQAYLQNGRYSESAQMLRKVNPASLPKAQQANYQKLLAAALDRSGDSGGALAAWKRAAEANPNDSDAWYAYGTAAFNEGDTAAGVSALEKAARLDAGDVAKHEAYAKALIRYGRERQPGAAKQEAYTKAVAAAQKVAAANGSYDNLLLVAEAQLGAKDYSGAVQTLNRAAARNGNDFLVHFYLSQALGSDKVKQYPQAESAARQALAKAGKEADKRQAWSQIGYVNEKLKNYDDAILAYRNAGDGGAVQRVEENKRISAENQRIEADNEEIRRLEEERRKLEAELKELPGGGS